MKTAWSLLFAASVAALFYSANASAQAKAPAPAPAPAHDAAELVSHPWVVPAPVRSPVSYFTNLSDGDVRESPVVVRFGLSMRGIVPAGKTAGRAGHHHLLVNQDLPLDFTQPLPFTDKYMHFGKGQMEAVLNLAPGTYRLQLLLADQGHIPYFIYSKPLTLTISKQNKDVTPATAQGPSRVEILSPANGKTVTTPFRVQFHASGFNISHAEANVPDTGHFRLTMARAKHKPEVMNFTGGQTEVWLKPPADRYSMKLELVSNTAPAAVMASTTPIVVTAR
jgi:hypothetical protein